MKRVPELRDLSDDHHTGLVLARLCRRAGREDAGETPENIWEKVGEAFAGHLEPHFRIEEEHLLPALEALGERSLAERVRSDHEALRALWSSAPPELDRVLRFGELLESHIRFEEREVFEATQHRLPRRVLDAIAAACRTIPRVCPASLAG